MTARRYEDWTFEDVQTFLMRGAARDRLAEFLSPEYETRSNQSVQPSN